MKGLILKNKLLIIIVITTVIISYYCISTTKNYFSTVSFRWNNGRAVALYLIDDDDAILRIYKNKLWYRVGFSCYSEEVKLNEQITANLNEWHISRITTNSIELNADNERKIIHYDCN